MMRNGHDDWMLGVPSALWIGCAIATVLITLAVLTLVLLSVTKHDQSCESPTVQRDISPSEAIELLERRFATGEIDEDEFSRRRSVLLPSFR